jgi:hypothetical protein
MSACFHDAAQPPVATPPPAPIAQSCTVRGERVSLDSVQVRPDGDSAFQVGISDEAVEATFRANGTIQLAVHGAIELVASADVIPVHITEHVAVERGQLRLAPGATVLAERLTSGRLAGAAVMYSELANVYPDGRWGPAESIATTDVPCDRTTLEYIENDNWLERPLGDGTWWQVRGGNKELALRAEPRDDARAITYTNASCWDDGPCFTMTRITTRGEWTQLANENEHVVVTGWIRTAQLDKVPDGVLAGGYSYCGCDDRYSYFGESGTAPEHDAHIAPGTHIFTAPGKGVWATVVGDEVFRVRYRPGDEWAEVVTIPGVGRARWEHTQIRPPAWVPVATLQN